MGSLVHSAPPTLLGPLKSPNCRSPTLAAGWRCGSSYPGRRRQGGGGATAEPGLGAGGPSAPAQRALPSPPSSPSSALLHVQARPAPAPILTPIPPPPQPRGPPLPLALLGFPTRQAKVGPEAGGPEAGAERNAGTRGVPAAPSLFSPIGLQVSLDPRDVIEPPP